MNSRKRWTRWAAAFVVAGIIAAQMPFTDTAAFAAGKYGGNDTSGDFLGISGISNQDAIETAVAGLAIYGVIAATQGNGSSGAGTALPPASSEPGGTTPPTAPTASPSPAASPAAPAPTTSLTPTSKGGTPAITSVFDTPLPAH
jgi:hypothetical protein